MSIVDIIVIDGVIDIATVIDDVNCWYHCWCRY